VNTNLSLTAGLDLHLLVSFHASVRLPGTAIVQARMAVSNLRMKGHLDLSFHISAYSDYLCHL